MAGTFGTYTNVTYTLTVNPTTITSAGTIDVNSTSASAAGILGTAGTAWTLTNQGTVESLGSLGIGVYLESGGLVTNGTSGSTGGLIKGGGYGVDIGGSAGTVANYGTIEGTNAAAIYLFAGGSVGNTGLIEGINGVLFSTAAGTVTNSTTIIGTSGPAIALDAGGSVGNTGLIEGYGGVYIGGATGTVTNSLTIAATGSGIFSYGINLTLGGSVTNGASGSTTALIQGGGFGVEIKGSAGTVVNYGSIENSSSLNADIYFGQGGSVTNHGLISSPRTAISFHNTAGTIDNFGTIISTAPTSFTAGAGVYLESGGLITNEAGGLITALKPAISLGGTTSAGATVINAGTVIGLTGVNVSTADTGSNTVVNSGTIQSTGITSGAGVYFPHGGVVTNQTAGLITAIRNAVSVLGNAATIGNSGTIQNSGTNATIYARAGGTITNAAGATIDAAGTGTAIVFKDTVTTTVSFGTVLNSGTIQSTGVTAGGGVYFGQGGIVTNQTAGLITAYRSAISSEGSAVAVTNFGTIRSTGTANASSGVFLGAGGSINNQGVIEQSGTGADAISISGSAGTIVNSGTILATNSSASGTISASGIFLGAGGTITNTGTVSSASANNGAAVDFGTAGGEIVNGTSGGTLGLITAYHIGVGFFPGTVGTIGTLTVVNYGTIQSTQTGTAAVTGFSGNALQASGVATISNFGTISAAQTSGGGGGAILLQAGGSITNSTSGLITAAGSSSSVQIGFFNGTISSGVGTITNYGMIAATGTAGFNSAVSLQAGGSVDNHGTITAAGSSGGVQIGFNNGTTSGGVGTVTNYGAIEDTGGGFAAAVNLNDGGSVANHGSISGPGVGVQIGSVNGTVTSGNGILTNYGTIRGTGTSGTGANLAAGGSVSNGGSGSTAALIEGTQDGVQIGFNNGTISGGVGTVTNFGTIAATGTAGFSTGVNLQAGGSVDNHGTITAAGSGGGVQIGFNNGTISGGVGTVTNYGMIEDTGGGFATGVNLIGGGSVANHGSISGPGAGVQIGSFNGTVTSGVGILTNYGTILGTGTSGTGANLTTGGSVSNGGSGSTGALIEGTQVGVQLGFFNFSTGTLAGGVGTLTNYGTILGTGTSGTGANLTTGGSVSNGGSGSTGTLIEGTQVGVQIGFFNFSTGTLAGGVGTVTNFGTIEATGTSGIGANLATGGSVSNGGSGSTGALIAGTQDGVQIGFNNGTTSGGVGTVTNFGTIEATGTGGPGFASGIGLSGGGTIINGVSGSTGGLITAYDDGINSISAGTSGTAGIVTIVNYGIIRSTQTGTAAGTGFSGFGIQIGFVNGTITSGSGTVANFGTISAAETNGGGAILLQTGGFITNSASGLITSPFNAISIHGSAGTVVNSGTISQTGTSGFNAIFLGAGGTVIDSGTISSTTGVAVNFSGSGSNLLVLEHGYKLVGGVYGTVGATNTLELGGSLGAAVTASYNGLELNHFHDALFGTSGHDTLKVTNTAGTLPVTISGFTLTSDIVDLTGLAGGTLANNGTVNGSDQLVVSNGSQTVTLQLDGSDGTSFATAFDGASGTDVTACFCRGTLILTDRGEAAVEDLAIGDRVMTLSGEAKPVRWIGRRAYGGRFVAGNRRVQPIRVAAGAVADGVPARDLWVSPEHALYLDGALVPAGLLVNGASIVQAEEVEEVEYFHIEFAGHEVIFADGAPAESFVDDDSRNMFHNAAEFHALYPEAPSRVPASYCAPRIEGGFALEALRRRLAGRARNLGTDGTALPAVLRGNLELVHRDRIAGWAFDPASPAGPVTLVVLDNGAEIGRVVAERYRRDLDEAGIGDGHHAFELFVPGGLAAGVRHEIEVRQLADWGLLPGSPGVLEADRDRKPPRPPAAASLPLGALRGNLDTCERTRIAGWAQDSADPERRVGLIVKVDDQVIGRVLANSYRGDLEAAGIGDGRHGFELSIPNTLSALQARAIRVEREADGAELPGSPVTLPAATGFDAAIEQNVAGILASLAAADEERALAVLTQQTDQLLARRAERHGGRAERESHRLFRRRWGRQAEHGPESFKVPHLRALVVDSSVPCATRDAGSVAILSHVRALRALGYEVSFAASDDMGNAEALARLAEAEGIATCGGPYYSCLEDVLCRQAGSFDLVYLHRAANADRYLALARRYCPKARILYSVADLHHLRLARQAQVERRPELLEHSRYIAAVEILAARRADIVITHSPVEAELLRRAVGFGKVHVVPFAIPPRRPRRPFAERRGMAILGGFDHPPNPDAVHYLSRDILPRVWARDPGLTCKIVGHGWHEDRLPGLDRRIEMIGEVEDLDEVFDTVRLTVAPLRFGAGIKGKVLDSFAAGLPCIMTPIAAEGLSLTGSLPQLVGDAAAGLARLIVHLHTDRDANEQAAMDGTVMVAQQFCAERVTDAFRKILNAAPTTPIADDSPSRDTAKMTAMM